jgi:hypothetical protein
MPIVARNKKLEGALLQLALTLALLIAIWFPGVRLTDWRLNELCGWAILLLLPISLIRVALSVWSRLLRYVAMAVGITLLPFVLFGSLDHLLESSRTGFIQDPWFSREWQFGSAQYRFYHSNLGGMGQPATGLLRREWDTPYGVKFVQPIWGTVYWCCGIELRQSNGPIIEVVDKAAGRVTVLAEIDSLNGNVLVNDNR